MTCRKRKSKVPIGLMDKVIQIQEKTRTQNDSGGWDVSWSTIATVAASVEPTGGSELTRAEQIRYPATHVIKTWYRTDISITGDHRIVWDSRNFNIHDVRDLYEDNRFYRIVAEENVAQ